MNETELKAAKHEAEHSAVAWFAVLERARQQHDFSTAAQAKDQLERLGVFVRYALRRIPRRQISRNVRETVVRT